MSTASDTIRLNQPPATAVGKASQANKRTRFDQTAETRSTTPTAASESSIASLVATLQGQTTLQSLVRDSFDKIFKLQFELNKRLKLKQRFADDGDYFPGSKTITFKLETFLKNQGLEQHERFEACKTAVNKALDTCKTDIRAELVKTIDLEISHLKQQVQETFVSSLGNMARIFCIRYGIDPDTNANANALVCQTLRSASKLLKYSYFSGYDILTDPQSASIKLGTCLTATFELYNKKFPSNGGILYSIDAANADNLPADDDDDDDLSRGLLSPERSTQGSQQESPRSPCRAPENAYHIEQSRVETLRNVLYPFSRACQVVYHDAWDAYKQTETTNQLELKAKKEFETYVTGTATQATAMQATAVTINSEDLKEAIDERLGVKVNPLQKKVANLEKSNKMLRAQNNNLSKNLTSGARRGAQGNQNSDNSSKTKQNKTNNTKGNGNKTGEKDNSGNKNGKGRKGKAAGPGRDFASTKQHNTSSRGPKSRNNRNNKKT